MASECAAKQDKFWEYADQIFTKTSSNDSLPDEELFTIADAVGLDRKAFDACLANEETKTKVKPMPQKRRSLAELERRTA